MNVQYHLTKPPFSESQLRAIVGLARKVFGEYEPAKLKWRLSNMPDVTSFEAIVNQQLVGFKVGYAMKPDHYYSWLGGVDPLYHRRGIARELMDLQHKWLLQNQYATVETDPQQNNFAMSQLNLSSGFQVVGLRIKYNIPHIVYEKKLKA